MEVFVGLNKDHTIQEYECYSQRAKIQLLIWLPLKNILECQTFGVIRGNGID
jgi:hypothetical protein